MNEKSRHVEIHQECKKQREKIQPKEKERTNQINDKTFAQQVLCAHFSIGLNYSISNRLQTIFPLFSL